MSPASSDPGPVATSLRQWRGSEWREYRDLRLRALADSPDAFGSTLEAERSRPDEHWAERLSTGVSSDLNLPLVALNGEEMVGLVWGRIEPSTPNTVHVYQMWVAPESRGLGIGSLLLERVVEWARAMKAEHVMLGVTCGDTSAKRLYARAGFQPIGDPHPLRPGSTLLSQHMTLTL